MDAGRRAAVEDNAVCAFTQARDCLEVCVPIAGLWSIHEAPRLVT